METPEPVHGTKVSKVWSCTTLGEGLAHVNESVDDEEAALLEKLKDRWVLTAFSLHCLGLG